MQQWSIFFDLDGTLYGGEHHLRYQIGVLSRHLPDPRPFILRRLNHLAEIPARSHFWSIREAALAEGIPEMAVFEAFQATRRRLIGGKLPLRSADGLSDFLSSLRERHRLHLVTNSGPDARQLLQRLDIEPLFDSVVVHANKPEGWQRILEQSGAEPERTIGIGDNYENDIRPFTDRQIRAIRVSPRAPVRFESPSLATVPCLTDAFPIVHAWLASS